MNNTTNLINPKKTVYFDMDGVLCELHPEASVEDMMKKDYFASLKPRKEMVEAVKALVDSNEYEVYVLSAVIGDCREQSVNEKNAWLDKYLPEIIPSKRIFTISGTPKNDAIGKVTENDVLLDDHSPNLMRWVSAGGKAVKVLNEYNGRNNSFIDGPRVNIEDYNALRFVLSTI